MEREGGGAELLREAKSLPSWFTVDPTLDILLRRMKVMQGAAQPSCLVHTSGTPSEQSQRRQRSFAVRPSLGLLHIFLWLQNLHFAIANLT